MKNFILYIIILITSIKVQAQSDTNHLIKDAIEFQKHSNLFFWYATESENQLKYYLLAEEFAEKSNLILNENQIKNLESDSIRSINQNLINNIYEIQAINSDNMNGRFPLFNQIMGITPHNVLIDDANELSIEDAVVKVGTQLKGSKTIFNLPYFSVIESNYKDEGVDEVIRQVAVEESNHYIIPKFELYDILGSNKSRLENQDYNKLTKAFDVNKIGVINVDLIDSVGKIYYNSATFYEYDSKLNDLEKIAYSEAFKHDVKKKRKEKSLFLLFTVLFLLLILVPARGFFKIDWRHYLLVSIAMSYLITYLLVLGLKSFPISGNDYYLEYTSLAWRALTAIIFSIIPIVLTYIGIMKLKFLVESVNKPSSIISIIYGVCVSSLIFFVSLEVFENGITGYLYNYLLVLLILFLPAQTTGRIASRLLINHEKIYLIPLLINLLAISFIFYSSLLQHTLLEVFVSIFPVLILSFVPLYFDEIISFFKNIFKDSKPEIINSIKSPIYIEPEIFSEKSSFDNLFSNKILKVNLVSGEKGTGKSRFLTEIKNLHQDDIKVYYGDCDQETSVINYEPFVEAFQDVLGAGTFAEQSSKANMLSSKLSDSGLLDVVPGGKVLNVLTKVEEETIRDYKFIIKEITNHLKAVSNSVLIAIDDLHNIDENSLELLSKLIYEIGINYDDYENVSFLITSTDSIDNESGNLNFLNELHSNEIIQSNIIFDDLLEDYSNFSNKFLKNMNLEYESEMRISDFLQNHELEYPLHIVEAIKLIDTYKMFNHLDKLSLKKNVDLMTLPINKVISGIYQEKIEGLDTELFTILECAAYIGKTFEANVIVHIIGKDRLEILNRLREAEDMDLVSDKSDEDDIYEFTSRSLMKEIRNYSVKRKGESDVSVSQIVKEYNDRIINYFYKIEGFDIHKLDINLLISLAIRSFENNFYRKKYNQRCVDLNKAAAERTYKLGKFKDSLKMFLNLYKLASRFELEEIKLECLYVIVECYLEIGEVKKALEYESDLKNCSFIGEAEISKDLLLARLYSSSSRETNAFDLLKKVQGYNNTNYKQKITLNLLLAEIFDYREEDELALNIYNEILKDKNLKKITRALVLSKVSDICLQHGQINEANTHASEGYKLAIEQNSVNLQSNLLFQLICISLRLGNSLDFRKYRDEIIAINNKSDINIQNQLSLLLCNFVFSNENDYEFNKLESDISRLLKMVKYNNDQHKESQIFIFEIISSLLNGKSEVCISKIEKYISSHKLDEDLRIEIVLELLFTDLSILNGTRNFSYFDKIDYNIVKEIPTLLPKFNYLLAIKNDISITKASEAYYEDIKKSKIYFMAEEFPFSISLNADKELNDSILNKFFKVSKLRKFLNLEYEK
jgi:hypothetical protein